MRKAQITGERITTSHHRLIKIKFVSGGMK